MATPPSDDTPLLESRHRTLLLIGVIMVAICQVLDVTIASIALPQMKATLGASNESVSWVLTSFIIATAIGTPLNGWLSDRVGSRNLFLGATVLFLVASAACGAATSLSAMVLFRVIQGVASAFIGPMAMTIIYDVSPPSKQVITLAYFSMVIMVAPISGPLLGGVITQYLNWRWIYYINLPIGIPALFLLWWLLPSRPLLKRRLDMFGFAAIAIGLGALQLLLDRGQQKDWFESWEIIIEAILALSGFWVFFIHSRSSPNPLYDPVLFKNGNFVIALAFLGVMGLTVTGLSSVLPMMFQSIYGYEAAHSGLMMAPRGFGLMITSLLAGRLARYIDFRVMISGGFLIVAGAIWTMTGWTLEMDSGPILLAAFVQGLGIGLLFAPLNQIAFATLPPALRPDGSSLMTLFRSVGGSVGISIIITVLARTQQTSHADLAGQVTSSSFPAFDLPGLVDRLPGLGTGVLASIDAEVNRQALMIAFLDNFYWLAWLVLACAPLPYLIGKRAEAPLPARQLAELQ